MIFLFIALVRVPAEYIKSTINEDYNVTAAAQFIIYLVAYPTKFAFDLVTAWGSVFLALVFFFFQVFGFVGSLNGFVFQPFLIYADENISKDKLTFHLSLSKKQVLIIMAILILVVLAVVGSLLVSRVIESNELYNDASELIADTLEDEDMTNGYIINSALYDDSNDRFLFVIKQRGYKSLHWARDTGMIQDIDRSLYNNYRKEARFLDVDKLTRLCTRKVLICVVRLHLVCYNKVAKRNE